MNERERKQLNAVLADEREIGGHVINPLSPARMAILDRRGNKLVTGGGEQSDLDAAYEVFFVVTQSPQTLVSMRRISSDDWRDAVEEFALSLPDEAIGEFMVYLQEELEAIDSVSAKPEKTTETTDGRGPTGSPAVSGSDSPTVSRNMAPFGT